MTGWLQRIFFRRRLYDDIAEELHEHIEEKTQQLMRLENLPRGEAERVARRAFGNLALVEERSREVWQWPLLESIWADIKYALRQFWKARGFTTIVVGTLGLGVGLNVALFSILDGMLLRPLPVRNPQRLVSFSFQDKSGWSNGFSYPAFKQIKRDTADLLSGTSALFLNRGGFAINGIVSRSLENYVSCGFFSAAGIAPSLGRLIVPSDCTGGGSSVVVLGYSLWKNRLGGDPSVIGRKAFVNGHPVTVIGVAPKGFHGMIGLLDADAYLPLNQAVIDGSVSQGIFADPAAWDLTVFGWTKPGVSTARLRPAIDVVGTRLMRKFPAAYKNIHLYATPLGPMGPSSGGSGELISVVAVFVALTSLILILACVNVANLIMVRTVTRHREIAVRFALGARRGRIVRQLFTETMLLGLLGCAAGMLLGTAAIHALPLVHFGTDLPIAMNFEFDWRVYAYAITIAIGSGLLVGVSPALRLPRLHLHQALQESGRTIAEHGQRLRTLLSISQIAAALVLLIVAGLFVRSFDNVLGTDLGFKPGHVLNLSFDAHDLGYTKAQGQNLQVRLLDRVRSLPGVTAAAIANVVPMGYTSHTSDITVNGIHRDVGRNSVSTEYFDTLRIPVLRGRNFQDSDTANSQPVAIVNQAMARQLWPGKDPIGSTFKIDSSSAAVEVVGIAKDSHTHHITGKPGPYLYLPIAQQYDSAVTLQVRTLAAPHAMTHEIVQAIHSVAPRLPVSNIQTMQQATVTLNGSMSFEVGAVLSAGLGGLGLVLAIVGLYGVISFAAARRTAEIGLRIAMGAGRRDIFLLILKQGILIIAIGIAFGSLVASLLARLMSGMLYGVSTTDPATYLSISFALSVVALIACLLPASRAARVDPMTALRAE